MGKKRNFLGILASLFIICFVGNALAATGYVCPDIKKYTSCAENYYLNGTGVGNACVACGANSATAADNQLLACNCNTGYSADGTPTGATTSTTGCKVITYSISYGLNGGTNATSGVPTSYTYGNTATINGIPTKADNTFAGWCTDSGLTSCAMSHSITATTTGNKTYYAKWTTCTACAATNASCTLSVVSNTCTYTTACNAGYGSIQNNGKYNASCTANSYTVTLNANNGTGGPASVTATYAAAMPKLASLPTRAGYTFTGYYDATTGGTKYYNTDGTSAKNWDKTAAATLYAQWSQCTACAPTNANCSLSVVNNVCTYTTSCKAGYSSIQNNGKYNPSCSACNSTTAGLCGCSSTQYPANGVCTACTKSCSTVSGFTQGSYDVCTSQTDSICYRNCTTADVANSATVSGTVTKGGTKTCAATKCATNYFLKNSACSACPTNATCNGTGTITCNAGYELSGESCKAKTYTVTLNQNSGTGGQSSVTVTYGAEMPKLTSLPTRATYSFVGYFDAATGGTQYYSSTGTSSRAWNKTQNTTLYAHWSQNTVACQSGKYYNGSTYVTCPAGKYCPGSGTAIEGGEGCMESCPTSFPSSSTGATSINSCYKSCTTVCTEPTGCPTNSTQCTYNTLQTFAGIMYYNTSTCETTGNTACPIDTLSCKMRYYQNGTQCDNCNTLGDGSFTLSQNNNFGGPGACYKSCSLACTPQTCPSNATCEHDTDAKTQGGIYYNAPTVCTAKPSSCEITITCNTGYDFVSSNATCVPHVYTITLNDNGGSGGSGSVYEKYATGWYSNSGATTAISKAAIPTRTDYTFLGYYTATTGGSVVIPANGTLPANTMFTADTTLHAQWSLNTTVCQSGKYYNGTSHVDCPSGSYCPGVGSATIGQAGCSMTCPAGYTGSDAGATNAKQCYASCAAKTIDGGTTTVVNAKEYYNGSAYPACTWNVSCNVGYKASGNGTTTPACTKCQDGEYCQGGSVTEPEECPAGSYCEGGVKNDCPVGGTSDKNSGSITDCYKTCPAPGSIENGTLANVQTQVYYTGTAYDTCTYRATCEDGYTAINSPGTNPTCIWADPDACPVGYYCQDSQKFACPDGGTTEGGATDITQCYKDFDPYNNFTNGVASARCHYLSTTSKYENCKITEVKSCKAGYWYSTPGAFLCSGVESGFYSPEGDKLATACPINPSGSVASTEYADNYDDCYKTCAITVDNSTSVAAKDNTVYGNSATSYDACSFAVTCATGYTVANNNTENPSCDANEYTITLNKNGGVGNTPATVNCTFDSGACALPATSGLTRTGYTAVAKWCSNANGGAPCYDAGTNVSANISADGTDTTLYAVWQPNVYTINLNHQSATVNGDPSVVYLKYATGWFANEPATTSITKMTTVPTKSGYEFAGYYNTTSGGVQVIDASGKFITTSEALTMTSTNPSTIYAKWSAGKTVCDAGTYYSGNSTTCLPCTANNYCPGGTFGVDGGQPEGQFACPDGGESPENSESSAACYKRNLTYSPAHGDGTQRCFYDEDSGYTANCDNMVIKSCDAGYWLENASDTDCAPVGNGYFSGTAETTRNQCPNGGDTETETSDLVQDCFKIGLNYAAEFGTGTQRCFYSSGDGTSAIYQRDCDTKVITACRGGYWLENSTDIDCVAVGFNNYSATGDTLRYACPANGETRTETSDDIKLCFRADTEYLGEHGSGKRVCFYTSGTGDSAIYKSSCETPAMTSCDAGYYYDSNIKPDDCIEVGIGFYSHATNVDRTQCPTDGLTQTKTSASVSECYLDGVSCVIQNGTGEHTCNYDANNASYSASCTTCTVTGCDAGYSQVDNTCINCPADNVCEGGEQKTCASITGGTHPNADAGTTDSALCYATCKMGQNAAEMTGRDYYNAPDTCEITRCQVGYRLDNGVCTLCPAGSFCDGTDGGGGEGGDVKSCADLGDGSWEYSESGATDESGCYRMCEEYKVENGTAIPVSDKAFYPNDCQFKGVSDNGNECEIVDDRCIETSCRNIYEMINGICVPCNRENALSYKPEGNCVIETCVTGYHPNGQVCEADIKECNAPNAISAEQKWDYKLNSFGICTITECDAGYHLASNACVLDEQPCAVENGVGIKEWNHATNTWGACVATSCDPGYTNDPSETNERSKPCGQCKNKFSVLGELAASSYVKGCEIASCMYQGEMYNLDNNECVPICDVNGYEDETGTMKWDKTRKKCVRTCKEGYTMW